MGDCPNRGRALHQVYMYANCYITLDSVHLGTYIVPRSWQLYGGRNVEQPKLDRKLV